MRGRNQSQSLRNTKSNKEIILWQDPLGRCENSCYYVVFRTLLQKCLLESGFYVKFYWFLGVASRMCLKYELCPKSLKSLQNHLTPRISFRRTWGNFHLLVMKERFRALNFNRLHSLTFPDYVGEKFQRLVYIFFCCGLFNK